MIGGADATAREQSAAALGHVARALDGSTSRTVDGASRQRFLVAVAARRRRMRFGWAVVPAAAAVAVLAVAFIVLRSPETVEYRITGPLTKQGAWLRVSPDRSAALLEFSEGTEIELGPGSRSRVENVTAEGASLVLGEGRLHARVVHRARARWRVKAGPYVVEVTGTAFDVVWSAAHERLELSLHDGGVTVKGPSLQDGLRIVAGQRLVAHARTKNVELSSLFSSAAPESKPAAESNALPEASSAPPPAPTPRTRSWSELLAAGDFRAVLDAARGRGIEQALSRGSLADLVALSDAARYAGDGALSRRGLLAQRSRFGSSAEARAAAFVLGRMADDRGASREALKWYDAYLVESHNGPFAAEALGRKLVVLVRSGDKTVARATAQAYLERFPRGAHASYAREVLPSL